MSPAAVRSVSDAADVAEVPPPSRRAKVAAYASALSAVLGFLPLHLVWAFGIPLFADKQRFATWYDTGGGPYLFALNAQAVLPAILAVALVRPWGLVFPRWVALFAGRRVPRLLPIVPGYVVSVFLLLFTLYATVLLFVQINAPNKIFSPWIIAYAVPQFLVWSIGLYIATRSYAARTSAAAKSED